MPATQIQLLFNDKAMNKFLRFFGKRSLLVLIMITLFGAVAVAQFHSISGIVTDEHGEPLPEANVALYTTADTLLIRGVAAKSDGEFNLRQVPEGSYNLVISFLGFRSAMIAIEVSDQDISDLQIRIQEEPLEMEGVEITARAHPVQVRGDTTVFTAAAFPVHSDAMAEDLLRRMPGFTFINGRIQAQGEEVEQVLVDGEEFFGDDPSIALRNLPAEIIRQIEVFDQVSDQAEFTGFSDGETIRTVNIITRGGIRDGQFGRANASLGTDERYLGGGNINLFSGPRRISILGLSNNINQLNFSSDYLAGVAQASQATSSRGSRGGGGGSGGGGGGGGGDGSGSSGGSGDWGSPDNTRDFLIGDQQGINNINSFGINYIDRWNDSWRVSSSYFFNRTANTNDRIIERQFLDDADTGDRYYEESLSTSENYNHRFNARIEHTIDPYRSLIIRPRVNLRYDESAQALTGSTFGLPLTETNSPYRMLNETLYSYDSDNFRYDINNSILYRRRFETQGRTFSVNLLTRTDSRTGDQLQIGESRYYDDMNLPRILTDDQNVDIDTWNRVFSANFQYTEPITERSQIFIGYVPSIEYSHSKRYTYRLDEQTDRYDIPDLLLSSQYDNQEFSHQPSVGYRLRGEGFHFNTSIAWQHTSLEGEQLHPQATETQRTFSSLLPRAMVMYRFSDATNIRLMYHTRTRTPSVIQLQDVLDVTNPLLWTGGNPDLKEQYVHRFILRYRSINANKQTSLLGFANVNYTQDYIGNSTILAEHDIPLQEGIILERGTRLITPAQTGNAWDMRTFLNYSLPVSLIRSNLNLNTGTRYRKTPTFINDERNIGHQTDLDVGTVFNSTISREVDFTLSYNAGYRFVRNSLREDLNDDYYTGRATFRFNVLPWQWLVLESDLNVLHYHGLSDEFNRNITYWNASAGYRFMTNRAAQLRFTVTDILGQNSSINRMVTDIYVQDVQSEVLTRYFMLTFSYNFRAFQEGRR